MLDLDSRISKGVRRTAISFQGQLNSGANFEELVLGEELQPLISRLANDFQEVIATSAGFNSEAPWQTLIRIPPRSSRPPLSSP